MSWGHKTVVETYPRSISSPKAVTRTLEEYHTDTIPDHHVEQGIRQLSGLHLDCPYRDVFAGAPEEPLPPFHILPIDGDQLGTRAPCSQSDQNILGVIAQGYLPIAARICGHHLPSSIEILRLRRHHTPHTCQRTDYPIEILFIPTAARPDIELHPHHRAQEKAP
jgi:hypothetical protein